MAKSSEALGGIAGAAAMLIIGLYIISSVYGTVPASDFHKVHNETITQDVGNYTQLAKADIAVTGYNNATVYNQSGGLLTAGNDYKYATGNTSIKILSSANTTDGNTANVTYAFDAKPASARNSIGTIGSSFALGAVAVIVLVAAYILSLIGGFGSNGGAGGRR